MFIPEWVDNQDVIYTFNKLLFNLKTFIIRMKLWHTLQYKWRQCVKEKKPDTKGWIRFDSAYKGYLKQIKFLERKTNGGCQGLGEEENGELLFNEYGFQFMNMQRIQEMDGGDGCTEYKCT